MNYRAAGGVQETRLVRILLGERNGGQDPAIIHPGCQSKQLWKYILVPYYKLTNLMEIKIYSKEQIYFPGLCFGEHSPAGFLQILLVND